MRSEFLFKVVLAFIIVATWQNRSLALDRDWITPRLLDPTPGNATNAFLVHGKVEKLLDKQEDMTEDGRMPVRVAVNYVYWGKLPDKTTAVTDFYYIRQQGSFSSSVPGVFIPFEVGEEGIWLVMMGRDGSLEVWSRIRKKHDARFAQYVEQAKFLEAVQQQKGEKRFELALRNLTHATPEVAMSAAHIAVNTDAARALREVLKQAESPMGLQVGVQIAFDQAYVMQTRKSYRKEWWDSAQRVKFISSWPREAHDEETLNFVVSDLRYRGQTFGFEVPHDLALAAIAAVARNEKNPKAARKNALGAIAGMCSHMSLVDPMFDCITAVLRDSKDAELRRLAANGLPYRIELNPMFNRKPTYLTRAQIDQLVALERAETDAEVKRLLSETIKKANAALVKLKVEDSH